VCQVVSKDLNRLPRIYGAEMTRRPRAKRRRPHEPNSRSAQENGPLDMTCRGHGQDRDARMAADEAARGSEQGRRSWKKGPVHLTIGNPATTSGLMLTLIEEYIWVSAEERLSNRRFGIWHTYTSADSAHARGLLVIRPIATLERHGAEVIEAIGLTNPAGTAA